MRAGGVVIVVASVVVVALRRSMLALGSSGLVVVVVITSQRACTHAGAGVVGIVVMPVVWRWWLHRSMHACMLMLGSLSSLSHW